ncbi:TauD/TfdA family dioxygenase [Acetobacteraceae bacterium ESL0709]|nr:TauD/TfdA family dioxygenase [Acetobacteraceae bacterium ESL0697]MDF7677984.1 TauD/TfdA family dioxygenase [Acetobacteraceae bacterium ESL0709]
MKPFYVFSDTERDTLCSVFSENKLSPYENYGAFSNFIEDLASGNRLPSSFRDLCESIYLDRQNGKLVHLLGNSPVDEIIPTLDHDDPVADKYRLKTTFVGETFLGIFAYLLRTPLMSYKTRNNGDFFTDVVSINRFRGMRTGFTDGDLIYHNDRTSHPVRADFITLLGMRCPKSDLVYTSFVDGADILGYLSDDEINILSQPWYHTVVDDLTRETNQDWHLSEAHPIVLGDRTIRFQDTLTKPLPTAPTEAYTALLEFKDGIVKSPKTRHCLRNGDLFVFPNQQGLHNRERIEINDSDEASRRWLLKTYSLKDAATRDSYAKYWADGVVGCALDF